MISSNVSSWAAFAIELLDLHLCVAAAAADDDAAAAAGQTPLTFLCVDDIIIFDVERKAEVDLMVLINPAQSIEITNVCFIVELLPMLRRLMEVIRSSVEQRDKRHLFGTPHPSSKF